MSQQMWPIHPQHNSWFLLLSSALLELRKYQILCTSSYKVSNHTCIFLFLQDSGKVTHNLTLETATRTSAVASEKEAFVAVFEAATSIFNVRSITTDGNTSIRAFMRLQDAVKHGLDIWHICKNLAKNLAKKAKSVVSIQLKHIHKLAWESSNK